MSGYLSKDEYIAKYYNEPRKELLTDLYYKTRDNNLLQQENQQLKNILTELEEWLKETLEDYAWNIVKDEIQKIKERYK